MIVYPMILPPMILPTVSSVQRKKWQNHKWQNHGGRDEAALRGVALGFGCGSATLGNPQSKLQISLASFSAISFIFTASRILLVVSKSRLAV